MKRLLPVVFILFARLAFAQSDPIGLSLFFNNSQMPAFPIIGNAPRYLQEVDIVATTPPGTTDQGIQPLVTSSEFSALNWSGVRFVEEDWRADGTGKFQRQRFYRGALWMEIPSFLEVFPLNAAGQIIGLPLNAFAGFDNLRTPFDDGFIRRFTVRQIATGCPAINNCTGATFVVQGLVQFRQALHPESNNRTIPAQATQLRLYWTADLSHPRTVAITRPATSPYAFGYGFQVSMNVVNSPANGQFFQPGESLNVRLTYRDGLGNRLHPLGSLPTYGQFIRGEIASGLRYFDNFRINPTLYYALKHRESNLLLTLSGPTNKLKNSTSVVASSQLFFPQATIATTAVDGWTGLAHIVPSGPVLFGGLQNPAVWDTALSDQLTFTIPADAQPGTYVLATKARREFGGEALNRGATLDVRVGTAAQTTFTPKTGPCNTCHTGNSDIGKILHGIGDRRACFSCHLSLDVEPDTALDIRVHTVHDRSGRFDSNISNCMQCHLTPPSGPARGLLPH